MKTIEEQQILLKTKKQERNDLIIEKKKWQDYVDKLSILLDKLNVDEKK